MAQGSPDLSRWIRPPSDTELLEEHRPAIVDHIVNVHMSVQTYSKEFEEKLKRKNFATPKNYLDFLKTYQLSLQVNNKDFTKMATRYQNILENLKEAKEAVFILSDEL